MRRPLHYVLTHGGLGGLLAGALVALWFLVLDGVEGRLLHTPTALAAAVLGHEVAGPDLGLVLTYSVLHFAVFAAFGIAAAWFLGLIGVPPGILLGIVFGLGVLDGVHYGGLLITGSALLTVLPVQHVLAANVVAGIALMIYLRYASRGERLPEVAVLVEHPLVTRGLATGLLGAAAVALWFFLIDIVQGRPFFTPAALGSALFLGADNSDAVSVNVGIVAAYTLLHLAAFGLVGIAFVWAAEQLERAPGFWLLSLMGFVVLEAVFVGTISVLGGWVMAELAWWAVVGNLLAIAVMAAWIWRTHPRLRQTLLSDTVRTEV